MLYQNLNAHENLFEPAAEGRLVKVDAYSLLYYLTVCLDGSLPGYHLHRGFGSGANSWLVNLEVRNTSQFT